MRSLPLLLLSGCIFGGTPAEIPDEDFAFWGAKVVCDKMRECDRGSYEALYFSMADCRASQEVELQAQYDWADEVDCDYRPKKAGEAYEAILEMSCEDWYEGEWWEDYQEIWDDNCLNYTYTPYTTYGTYGYGR